MNRLSIWPDFRSSWIVHEDTDILVVDKPEGVPSQAANPDQPDDVVTRLRAFLGGYLGVHQRLDQDTSGVLVFARRREANAALAAQFEGRRVRKTYVACVSGWSAERDRATLRAPGVRRHGKGVRVLERPAADAGDAITHVRVLRRCGDRAMLELTLETGRTHQARVQLSHAGAPIAGDALYGGAPAPRLLLHARAVELEHPGTLSRVRFESPTPPEFDSWLDHGAPGPALYDDDQGLERALARAVGRRWALGRSETGSRATTAFRVVNQDGDGLPRLAVDAYGAWLVVHLYGEDGPWADPARRERLLDRLHGFGFDGIYLKVRPQDASVLTREPKASRDRFAPAQPVRGAPAPAEFAILEEGTPFLVRVSDGLSTGLFLDQRQNRLRVREAARGRTVANLFAYTCAFTVAAAVGGAKRTVSVDASAAALERGRANLSHAGVPLGDAHTFVADDVFAWLDRVAKRGVHFDLVILDPPTYSTTKRGRFVADHDYGRLASAALAIVGSGGKLLVCTNHRGISRSRFRRVLFDAARAAKRTVSQVKDLPQGRDFPAPPGGEGHLKSAWVSVD